MTDQVGQFRTWLTDWWPLVWRVISAGAFAYGFLLLLGMPQVWDWTL